MTLKGEHICIHEKSNDKNVNKEANDKAKPEQGFDKLNNY